LSSSSLTYVKAPACAWLDHVQCAGKIIEVKMGEGSCVKFDIFVIR